MTTEELRTAIVTGLEKGINAWGFHLLSETNQRIVRSQHEFWRMADQIVMNMALTRYNDQQ